MLLEGRSAEPCVGSFEAAVVWGGVCGRSGSVDGEEGGAAVVLEGEFVVGRGFVGEECEEGRAEGETRAEGVAEGGMVESVGSGAPSDGGAGFM